MGWHLAHRGVNPFLLQSQIKRNPCKSVQSVGDVVGESRGLRPHINLLMITLLCVWKNMSFCLYVENYAATMRHYVEKSVGDTQTFAKFAARNDVNENYMQKTYIWKN